MSERARIEPVSVEMAQYWFDCGTFWHVYRDMEFVDAVTSRTIDQIVADALSTSNGVTFSSASSQMMSDGVPLAELDIRLTPKQGVKQINGEQDGRNKRKAILPESLRWTDKTMPYAVGPGFDSTAMKNLNSAMAEWEEHTCVKFRPSKTMDTNYVHILDGEGCNSYVGMIGGGQVMNLGPGCKVHSVSLHEIGHALGLHHEQSRQDRDDFVWVRQEHMDPKYKFASDKKSPRSEYSYGVKYDYASIMHYGQNAFSTSKEPTIITHDPSWQTRIGSATHLSFRDIKIMNMMYKCNEHCESKTCPGEGFLDKNCQCICPGNPTTLCGTPVPEVEVCVDNHQSCSYWASIGECTKNPGYMLGNCFKSCDIFGPACKDDRSDCQTMAYRGDCKSNPVLMFDKCKMSCGICYGNAAGSDEGCVSSCAETPDGYYHACSGCDTFVMCNQGRLYEQLCPAGLVWDNNKKTCDFHSTTCGNIGENKDCRDYHRTCAYWASIGECYKNPNYMRQQCKRACASC